MEIFAKLFGSSAVLPKDATLGVVEVQRTCRVRKSIPKLPDNNRVAYIDSAAIQSALYLPFNRLQRKWPIVS